MVALHQQSGLPFWLSGQWISHPSSKHTCTIQTKSPSKETHLAEQSDSTWCYPSLNMEKLRKSTNWHKVGMKSPLIFDSISYWKSRLQNNQNHKIVVENDQWLWLFSIVEVPSCCGVELLIIPVDMPESKLLFVLFKGPVAQGMNKRFQSGFRSAENIQN